MIWSRRWSLGPAGQGWVNRADVLDDPRPATRDPRREECTICTALAPDAVFTVRTYATRDSLEPAA
jgi:hypothetical protein